MKYVFKTPDLGEGTTQAEIVEWRVKIGDLVREDQPIADLMTDKATVEISSPVHGTIVALRGAPGETMAVGSELVVFDVAGDAPAEESANSDGTPAAATAPDEAPPSAKTTDAPPHTAPVAERPKPSPTPQSSQAFAARTPGEKPVASPAEIGRASCRERV